MALAFSRLAQGEFGVLALRRYTAGMATEPNRPANPNPSPPVDVEAVYPCIGVCMADPGTGLCQGCGRPLAEPEAPDSETGG
ncbi:MAG: DUF1289 domain-containing protein [Fluviibacter sp.]